MLCLYRTLVAFVCILYSCALVDSRLATGNGTGSFTLSKVNSIWWLEENRKCSFMGDQIILTLGWLCDYSDKHRFDYFTALKSNLLSTFLL